MAYPGGIVVAVDARDGMIATDGWAEKSDMPVIDLARRFEDAGVASLLFTDVGRDGMLKGCNVEATVALAKAVDIPVIASGGVADIHDIHALRPHVADGIEGVTHVVRDQIRRGADWIKVYADYRWGPNGEARPTFTEDELRAMVEVAGSSGRPVVAHAATL